MCRSQSLKEKKSEIKKETQCMNVRQVEENSDEENGDYIFKVTKENHNDNSKVTVEIGGVKLNMVVDSGARCNIIDRDTCEKLKSLKIDCKSSKETKKIYAYGSTPPLKVAGTFWTKVSFWYKTLENTEFVVMEGQGKPLIGRLNLEC